MTQQSPGEKRAVDRILAADYVAGLQEMAIKELLARRDEAMQEESNVSYVRRLIQGRLDVLRFEQRRRADADGSVLAVADESEFVKTLASALVDGSAGSGPRTVRPTPLGAGVDPQIEVYSDENSEFSVNDVRFSNLRTLTEADLQSAVAKFTDMEHEVSQTRHAVQRVADELQAEIERRVADGSIAAGVI